MNKIIKYSEILFHNIEEKYEETIFSGFPNDILHEDGYNFGIFKIKLSNKDISKKQPISILFNVDCSGSMEEFATNNITKMRQVIFTLCKILEKLAEINNKHQIPIFVSVIAFDNSIHNILDFTEITSNNVELLKDNIKKMTPLDSTNIELSLNEAIRILSNYYETNPTHRIYHIQLTDGNPTSGETNCDILSKIINTNYSNIFIGFGLDHNSTLLCSLSNNIRSEYRFIENIELAGLVYGEIIHDIIYNVIDIGRIVVKNGLIYDWKENSWTSEIHISNMSANCEKTFQIKAKDIYEIEIETYGIINDKKEETLIETEYFYPPTFDIEEEDLYIPSVDLTPYAFRLKTQELLYRANNIKYDDVNDEYIETISEFKKDVKEFLKFMMEYMKKYNKINDKFMKLLCDDIYVIYRKIGKSDSNMWINSRQSSQGRQQTYSVIPNRVDEIQNVQPPRLKRNRRLFNPALTQRLDTPFQYLDDNITLDNYINENNNSNETVIESFNKTVSSFAKFPDIPYTQEYNNILYTNLDSLILDINDEVNDIDNYEFSNNIDSPYVTNEITQMMNDIHNISNINDDTTSL